MAKLSMPPIPLKMYRHFAVVTVLLTACLAMFADVENEEYYRQQAEEQNPQQETEQVAEVSTQPAYGEARLERRSESTGSFDYNDVSYSGGGFGRPMERGAQGPGINSSTASIDGRDIPGYSQAYLNSLSEEELEQLLQGLETAGMLDPAVRQRNTSALQAASRQRSGSPSGTFE